MYPNTVSHVSLHYITSLNHLKHLLSVPYNRLHHYIISFIFYLFQIMPQNYHRRTERQQLSHELMLEAIQKVINGQSIRSVAKEYGASKTTLERKVKVFQGNQSATMKSSFTNRQIFTMDQEKEFSSLYFMKKP